MPRKRGNGTGGISNAGDGRKTPLRVRVTVGYKTDPVTGKTKPITKELGYFRTKAIAEKVLADYIANPYDLNHKDITFLELYIEWLPIYLKNNVNSSDYERTLRSAYNYCSHLYHRKI